MWSLNKEHNMFGILGKKIGMSQIFKEDGTCVPVTAIVVGPCFVVQVKAADKNGYCAIQIGFEDKKEKRTNKPQLGHFKKGTVTPKRFIREIRVDDVKEYKAGQKIEVDIFQEGDFVDIAGKSIGKGFQGGMKRWGWSGGPEAHGSMSHRRIGSVGTNTTPGRILRGHHMPGHMGNKKITVQSLEVVRVDKDNNILLVRGAVPGHKGSYLVVKKAKKKKSKE